ncbi:MAG: endonuclease [Bacteroidetes bacterium]|nr:endonuclease [Bacteroidota bacterium]
MKRLYSTILRSLLLIIGLIIISMVTFIVIISVNDFQPEDKIKLEISNKSEIKLVGDTVSVLSWNMGYSGLGKDMDFFYDGGSQVRASRELSSEYLNENLLELEEFSDIDFLLLQEVDFDSKRSYGIDQLIAISDRLQDHEFSKALNYKVSFVPVPPSKPMGKVNAGLVNLSKYTSKESVRFAYPNIASWPDKLFLLDRCFMLNRYSFKNKELVVINTHNSYYVKEDSLRMIELNILKKVAEEEFAKGHFVMIGGDWNMNPPVSKADLQLDETLFQEDVSHIPNDFMEDWNWTYDSKIPTNRTLDHPLGKQTRYAYIDYFVTSPNIQVIDIESIDLGFENSDHNPVKFVLTFNVGK